MIHALAKRIASVFISGGVANPENEDIYTYACELFISTCTSIVIWLFVSMLFGYFPEGTVYILTFAILRAFTGGYHAEHHWGCILASTSVLALSLYIIRILPIGMIHAVSALLSLVSVCIVFALAPVGHKNKPIPEDKRLSLKKKARLSAVGFCICVLIGLFFPASSLWLAVPLSMFSVSMSMAYAVFIIKREGRKCK